MMLNPAKCAFGIRSGKFLGVMVSKRRIEANPDKIKVILEMEPPCSVKDVQKLTKRLIKWAIELGEFDIKYKPRTTIKAQALTDFVVECTIDNKEVQGHKNTFQGMDGKNGEKKIENKELWMLYFDGASKENSSGAGLVLQSFDEFLIECAMKLNLPTTNNEAEYEALIVGLGLAGTLRVKNLKVCGNSKLVVSQVNGEFEARDETMAKCVQLASAIMTQFDECHVEYILKEENSKADALSKFASSEIENSSGSVYFYVLKNEALMLNWSPYWA
ncbi:uncharacterized protein LOC141659908 [Apium graveolens]|uniref:uncharacterized protein LOC141659908 n=1 Tax=Apium graveolens TaxID=4045 RepID=UPI003D7AAB5D